jgi:hypothetical protein
MKRDAPSTDATAGKSRTAALLDRVRPRRRHDDVVMNAEVRLLAQTLEPFGMLSREELARRTDAYAWGAGTFEEALRQAVARRVVRIAPDGSVVLRRSQPAAQPGSKFGPARDS